MYIMCYCYIKLTKWGLILRNSDRCISNMTRLSHWRPIFTGVGLSADLCNTAAPKYRILTCRDADLSASSVPIYNCCIFINEAEHWCISGAKIKGDQRLRRMDRVAGGEKSWLRAERWCRRKEETSCDEWVSVKKGIQMSLYLDGQ